jgi:hypothetical protein
MKSILDPSFRYTASFDTDLRRTFARVRDEQRRAALGRSATPADRLSERAQRVTSLASSRIVRSPLA